MFPVCLEFCTCSWSIVAGENRKEREPPHDPKGKDDDTESERMQMETRGI